MSDLLAQIESLADERDRLAKALASAEAENKRLKTWAYCPECGSDEIHHAAKEHKQCAKCWQEWFSDVNYSDAVTKNLAERDRLRRERDGMREALEKIARTGLDAYSEANRLGFAREALAAVGMKGGDGC